MCKYMSFALANRETSDTVGTNGSAGTASTADNDGTESEYLWSQDRFDIKGCLKGRFQDPELKESHEEFVLKDQNFANVVVDVGSHRPWWAGSRTLASHC